MKLHSIVLSLAALLTFATISTAAPDIRRYDVIWDTPGKDAAGSMPLGNGELGINLWVEENGDLLFYLSRNDSFSEISQLCKAGKVRVSLSPNPFKTGIPFKQHLKLQDGVCEITAGEGMSRVTLRVFVDTDHPVVHVIGESASALTVTAKVESWRTEKQKVPGGGGTAWTLHNAPFELWQTPDIFPSGIPDAVAWYHRNEESTAFESTVKVQSLEPIRASMKDPLLHRTFGGWITGEGFKVVDGRTLTTAPVQSFALRVSSPSAQTATAQEWLELAKTTAGKSADSAAAMTRTAAWWRSFWLRSWVICDGNATKNLPISTLPLRVGIDQHGGNRFRGKIVQPIIVGEAVAPGQIEFKPPNPDAPAPAELAMPKPGLNNGFTIRAFINPAPGETGRIVDKITPGGSDGFLLDTEPGMSLRFIVGDLVLSAPKCLTPGKLDLVMATFDAKSGMMRLFLNDKQVASGSPTRQMTIGKAHTLQRYMQACAGRGIFPIKFNGSIFTVEPTHMGQGNNPDWRKWGDCHWWQNVRMPYHAMQACGDFDLMLPLFEMFENIRPFAEARAKLYHNVEGCYFAETMTVWGTYSNGDYGWNRTGKQPKDVQCPYWQFAWNQGLEVVALQLDYYDYTRDRKFLKTRLLPMAASVLKYFDTRFKKDAGGRILIDPTQSVETYWHGVINDTPCVAGLNDITTRLCALPESYLSSEQKAFFAHMKAAAPTLPVEDAKLKGRQVRRIAVAQKYNPKRSNCENPELFPIWPFRLAGLGRPLLEEARNGYALRGSHNDNGWGYDSNAAALLGLTEEADRILNVKIRNSHPAYRWPATWGPNFDWLPDHCHGGNLVTTTNLMLLQAQGGPIRILPAWPKDRDVVFKLHAPDNTTVECELNGGKITSLTVVPESRRKDVILPDWAK